MVKCWYLPCIHLRSKQQDNDIAFKHSNKVATVLNICSNVRIRFYSADEYLPSFLSDRDNKPPLVVKHTLLH